MSPEAQLEEKEERLKDGLSLFGAPDIEVFASRPTRYRMRAEFRIWHEGEAMDYVMFDPGTRERRAVEDLPIACERIRELMPVLRDAVVANPVLRHRLFQVEFLTARSGEALTTLIYRRRLDEAVWGPAATELASTIGSALIGRSRKQRIVLDRDHVTETFPVAGRTFSYRQIEGGFTQPNADINERMLNWVVDHVPADGRDGLELYCGNGNFSLPLSTRCRKLLVTEVDRTSVRALEHNLEANGINTVQHARLSASELSQALRGERPFRRLRHVDLDAYDISTVLVDPPRAGIDSETLAFLSRFERIVYISCNPDTLTANLEHLTRTHDIRHAALFDQFPGTRHVEAGLVLEHP